MRSSAQFREALHSITEEHVGKNVGAQLAAVNGLRGRWPHGVRAIGQVDLDDFRTWRFNCHAFTFGFWRQELFWCLQESHPDAWPNSAFVTEHLLPGMTAVRPGEAREGAVVLYYEGALLKHSGIVRGDLVESKWGRCHTWEHGLFEAPQSYGAKVAYYQPPEIERTMDAFLRFADAA